MIKYEAIRHAQVSGVHNISIRRRRGRLPPISRACIYAAYRALNCRREMPPRIAHDIEDS